MIRTVLNDIEKEKLGVTLCHEHFIVDLDRVRHDGISMIETPEEVEPEIRKMMALGVQAAVEVSTIDLGRDVRKLKQISLDTGLTIVASTGFYLTQYHPEWLASASAAAIAEVYVRELTEGIDDTGIKAGIIAEIASSPERFEGEFSRLRASRPARPARPYRLTPAGRPPWKRLKHCWRKAWIRIRSSSDIRI